MTHAMPATLPITTYYHYAAVHTCMPPGNQLGRLAKWNLPQLDGVAFGFLSWPSLLRAHLEWLCEESKREVVLVQGVNRLLYKHVQISNCILNELKYIIFTQKNGLNVQDQCYIGVLCELRQLCRTCKPFLFLMAHPRRLLTHQDHNTKSNQTKSPSNSRWPKQWSWPLQPVDLDKQHGMWMNVMSWLEDRIATMQD